MRKRVKQRLPESFESDVKVLYDHGEYSLVVTVQELISSTTLPKDDIIALDPGVRTFMTGYSPNGVECKFGDAHMERMKALHKKIDALRSVRDKAIRRRTRWRLKQRLANLEMALYNNIEDLHNQTASILSSRFGSVLLPRFGTSKMLVGEGIGSTTKRRMQGLNHYRFQQKLQGLCAKNKCNLYIVDESYTTMTCGACGKLDPNVGSAKLFVCSCGYSQDRDIHGARNIWIKTMTENGALTYAPKTIASE